MAKLGVLFGAPYNEALVVTGLYLGLGNLPYFGKRDPSGRLCYTNAR